MDKVYIVFKRICYSVEDPTIDSVHTNKETAAARAQEIHNSSTMCLGYFKEYEVV